MDDIVTQDKIDQLIESFYLEQQKKGSDKKNRKQKIITFSIIGAFLLAIIAVCLFLLFI